MTKVVLCVYAPLPLAEEYWAQGWSLSVWHVWPHRAYSVLAYRDDFE